MTLDADRQRRMRSSWGNVVVPTARNHIYSQARREENNITKESQRIDQLGGTTGRWWFVNVRNWGRTWGAGRNRRRCFRKRTLHFSIYFVKLELNDRNVWGFIKRRIFFLSSTALDESSCSLLPEIEREIIVNLAQSLVPSSDITEDCIVTFQIPCSLWIGSNVDVFKLSQ